MVVVVPFLAATHGVISLCTLWVWSSSLCFMMGEGYLAAISVKVVTALHLTSVDNTTSPPHWPGHSISAPWWWRVAWHQASLGHGNGVTVLHPTCSSWYSLPTPLTHSFSFCSMMSEDCLVPSQAKAMVSLPFLTWQHFTIWPPHPTDLFIQLLLHDGRGLLCSQLGQGGGVAALLALLAVQSQGGFHVMDVSAAQLQLPSQVIDLLDQRHVLLKRTELDG